MRSDFVREAGREPIFNSAISASGVICLKNVLKPAVSYTSSR